MGLAGSGRTEEQQRVAMRHPTAGCEFAELALVERGLGAPVEPLEVAHERELRDLRGHLDAPMVASGELPGHRNASASRRVISDRAASSSRLSSWSRIAVSFSRSSMAISASWSSASITSLPRRRPRNRRVAAATTTPEPAGQIGRASCREVRGAYGEISVVPVSLQKKKITINT